MNCTEVGELMQRNLDCDLNKVELETLMTHLSDCSKCTALFDRLMLLSGSLEQLPRVVPSISIVDAILPELERIDKAKANTLIRAKHRRTRWLTTAGSIATAAAIVVLMVNLNGTPASNNASIADVAMETGQPNNIANDLATGNLSVASSDGPVAATDSSGKMRATDGVSRYSYESGAVSNGPQDEGEQHSLEVNRISEDIAPTTKSPNSNNYSFAEKTPNLTTNPVLPEPTGSLSGGIDEMGVLNGIVTNINDQFGEDVATTIPQYVTADGQFYLQFEEHIIAMYETSSKQVIQQWELPQQGLYEFTQWNNEGKSFTFQVTNETGEITSYTWEIIERQ